MMIIVIVIVLIKFFVGLGNRIIGRNDSVVVVVEVSRGVNKWCMVLWIVVIWVNLF